MIKLNRTTEYGLIALRHISRQGQTKRASAREIADLFGLPFEITAKTLQRLKEAGLIQSVQGAHGGYSLDRPLEDVTLAQFLELMEGPQFMVNCTSDQSGAQGDVQGSVKTLREPGAGCEYHSRCEIKSMMGQLNFKMLNFLSGIRLAELIGDAVPAASASAPAANVKRA